MRILKTLNHILLLLLLFNIACSSNKEGPEPVGPKEPEINFSSEFPILAAEDKSAVFSFTTDADWILQMQTTQNADWLIVSPTTGKAGKVDLQIETKPNETYKDRNAYVKIKAGRTEKSFTITQKKKDAIILGLEKLEIPSAKGGRFPIEVKSNVDYKVTIADDTKAWIRHLPIHSRSGLNTIYERFEYDEGSEDYDREGSIIFSDGRLADTVQVFQRMRLVLLLTSNDFTITEEAQSFDVELKANLDYEFNIVGNVPWLKLDNARNSRVDVQTFKAEANTGNTNRRAQIAFYNTEFSMSDTLNLLQTQKNALILGEQSIEASAKETEIKIDLRANVDYEIIIPSDADWVTLKPSTRSLKNYTHYFTINKNDTGEPRKSQIKFKDKNSESNDILTLTQRGGLTEREALMALYNATNGDKWENNTNWGSDKPLNQWRGVGTTNEKVTSLHLYANDLEGEFPADFFNLPELQVLHISDSKLSGAVPAEIAKLKKLKDIVLSGNKLITLPPEFTTIKGLEAINLSGNSTWRNLKLEDFAKFEDLTELNLSESDTKGDFSVITNLSKLKLLDLSKNNITGFIPLEISKLNNLQSLSLADNRITGSIPTNISKLSNLQNLILGNNELSGGIPQSITEMTELKVLHLYRNNLTGNIPEGFSKLVNLSGNGFPLNLANNRLSGVIPSDFMRNPNYAAWDIKYSVLPQQDGYELKLPEESLYESTDYSKDGIVQVLQKATRGKGVDILFMGDGYVDRDMGTKGKYEKDMAVAVDNFFAIEPTKTYREYFNVYVIKVVSKHEVFSPESSTALDVEFGEGSQILGDLDKVFAYATKTPVKDIDASVVTVIANRDEYAGTCVMYSSGAAVSFVPRTSDVPTWTGISDYQYTILHESVGHGFAKLGDEYTTYNGYISGERKERFENFSGKYGWYANLDLTNNASKVKWSHFLAHPKYASYTGFSEGGFLYTKGVWKPESMSCMLAGYAYFNAPSREAIVKTIKERAGEKYSFSDFVAKDKYEPIKASLLRSGKEEKRSHTPPIVIEGSPKIVR